MIKIQFALVLALWVSLVVSLPVIPDKTGPEEDPEYGNHHEGDMKLNQKQLDAIYSPARNGMIPLKFRWPNKTVPYALSSNHTQKQNDHIELGLRTLESISCLKFVRRTDESDYVQLNAGDGGCYSHVGYQGGAQELNLKKSEPGSGCFRLATIIHEFLHALGFFHMQSAYDRDEYVTIVWDKISPGKEGNFKKYTNTEITHFNTTYDYYSVMHYGPNGFSIDGTATIVPTDPSYAKVIGQRQGLSEKDILKLNRMYECESEVQTS